MTTTALTVAAVRRLLKDAPVKVKLGAAQSDTTDETTTLVAGDITKLQPGVRLEHDDASGEQRRVLSLDPANAQFEAERGFESSTAATHSNSTYLLIAPRFPYDSVTQAINTVLDGDLPTMGVFDVRERQVTSSALTDAYNIPATTTEEVLSVYQFPSSSDEPIFMQNFSRWPINSESYADGAYIFIRDGVGVPGTDVFYLNCKERLSISTITDRQALIVQYLTCAHLLESEVPKRLAGPTNQGDRTIRSSEFLTAANYWRERAKPYVAAEVSDLRMKTRSKRVWIAR
jgi:hypothetical protein